MRLNSHDGDGKYCVQRAEYDEALARIYKLRDALAREPGESLVEWELRAKRARAADQPSRERL
jgi:hypothetical protein